ncbi:MAG: N-6 DNA methylase [Nitrospira sp.]|nr:N-6 DNA methylase [Nitrospira sp.]
MVEPMEAEVVERIQKFVDYVQLLEGNEKGEAQVYSDRLFQAFGHSGYKEAGATLEFKVKRRSGKRRGFADLFWPPPRVLIEMKSRGEHLEKHYRQAFEYWIWLVPDRPRHVVLCNFDEFWIYDFNTQLDSPVDSVTLEELPYRYTALNFLFPHDPPPLFGNDKVKVTREATAKIAKVFHSLIDRGESREIAQRYILQCVVAMFAEDFHLLPTGFFTQLLNDCVEGNSAYDLIGGLFRQMADSSPVRGGRYQGVRYFNGGLFKTVDPLELNKDECQLLFDAAQEQWASVAPPIFGTLFQNSMDQSRRHTLGAHFTHEVDIQKVVLPTIIHPWQERIERANTLRELETLAQEILRFRVLDPACGSGNFLYIAYRELVHLEMEILQKIHENFGKRARRSAGARSLISTAQFYGIDSDSFAVELAKVTLMLAKRIALAETKESRFAAQQDLPFDLEDPLPLDNLDSNIVTEDALFCDWPQADVIIGNPPYQSKNKMQKEFGPAYVKQVRARYPDVPGRADYCVYWFRHAHDSLKEGGRAGLVGTNTIRQNYSREGGLDYIAAHGGTIVEAVSSQVWSGDAVVHVSIVNWVKGQASGPKKLTKQLGDHLDSPWEVYELADINTALSPEEDVTKARPLRANSESQACYQGQTHGHEGFLLHPREAVEFYQSVPITREVVFPYLTAEELFASKPPCPQRYVIDFHPRDIVEVSRYGLLFQRIKDRVLPDREKAAKEEKKRNEEALDDNPNAQVNMHHQNFLKRWWLLSYPRPELISKITQMPRFIVCGQVTKRPIFAFVSSEIRPNAALVVFPLPDDYSFGTLQSGMHWKWFTKRCSTLKGDFRYTSNTVFDSFPWPQAPTRNHVKHVAQTALQLRHIRQNMMTAQGLSLRDLYRTLELPGQNPLKDVHEKLDAAVRDAYGMKKSDNLLAFLFTLNQELATKEKAGKEVIGPGVPPVGIDPAELISEDALRPIV